MSTKIANKPFPGISYFTPAQHPAAGTALDPQPDGKPIPKLFQPLKIRGTTFHNRIFLSPMCQYSADDGHLTAWHQAHLGGIFTRGPGLTIVEATAVLPEGRISPEDSGLWKDSQIEPLRKIVEFAHSQNQKVGIQLAHAGRKATTVAPWLRPGRIATESVGGWPNDVYGPSAVPFDSDFPIPKELTKEGIDAVVVAFAAAAKRALRTGADVIEIHNAHGYLLSTFLNEYGGSFENRIRLTLRVVDAVRAVIPEDMPLFLRVSATDWLEESLPDEPSWRVEDTVKLAGILADHGVDFLDVSSGGNHSKQNVKSIGAFQAPFAHAVKQSVGDKLVVGAVGGVTDGHIAQGILDQGQADAVLVGRQFQRNSASVWAFASDLEVSITVAHQMRVAAVSGNVMRTTQKA
ncbi:hypothetical protein SERLA73DRAFT_119581 [Serpula lacrymans var. lacrymans S7.3]|uniref:NADH:flavin oxidoreductase/NADH oxidase N-terminal domain-containing protein n=2 Tax=Serpula lacrymans var. lacrymans TaxID=341189 RepID=F8PL80_SERL3|nr:uncharacterized protein SERLADRAFT_365900 [Serpula lacrymans var. lacrymans S7.9]EGO03988.1 hypothetical protein SERLA73DRAFT_119581 [Serpula lacrymans var. lacrymans S7.3]EGO29908.1 hypothetical protein SERLADRAFT_365900 [Serpula lacrymans var. lacrymans S7.9]